MKSFALLPLALVPSLALSSATVPGDDCGSSKSTKVAAWHQGEMDIVDTAVKAGSFKTLATALGKAGLVDALKGDGPFTVFAPTDAAFAKLPAGTLEHLLKPENRAKLSAILTYHVVPGDVRSQDVVKLDFAQTLNGQRVDVSLREGSVLIDNAMIEKVDIGCTNGVIHVIDTVMIPE